MKKHGRKIRTILSIFLIIAIVTGTLSGYLIMTHQANAAVNDYVNTSALTEADNNTDTATDDEISDDNSGGDSGNSPGTAVMSSSVKAFAGEEAQQINAAISSITCENQLVTIKFDKSVNDSIKSLGIGDVFYLEGDSTTPFTDVYIGKVTSVSDNDTDYTIVSDSPTIDEVFDKLDVDFSTALTSDNLVDVDTVEGVEMTQVDSIDEYFNQSSDTTDIGSASTLQYTGPTNQQAQTISEEGVGSDWMITLDVDLAKAYNLVMNKLNNVETTDSDEDEDEPIELVAKLTGEIGVKNLDFNSVVDWDSSTFGFQDLSFGVTGKQVSDVKFEFGLEGEIGGDPTSKNIMNSVKFEALEEKMFPIFFLTYKAGVIIEWTFPSNSGIEAMTNAAPFTVAFVGYVDLSGNLSIKATFEYSQTTEFDGSITFVRDGKWVADPQFEKTQETDWSFEVEAKIDADTHVGASVMLYIFNLNVVDLALVKVGVELEGKASISVDSETTDLADAAEVEGHIRLYLKLLDIQAKLKINAELLFGIVEVSAGIDWTNTVADITLWEIGTRKDTHYNSDTMSYQSMTAQDDGAIYFKDTNGYLVKEDDGFRTILFTDEFFSICGIDESYIYILRANAGNYSMYRLDKEDGTGKKIVSSLTNCLMMDDTYIYYVPSFDQKIIERIDRETLKSSRLATFDNDVQTMTVQDGGYYVVTGDVGIMSAFFGTTNYYYLIDSSGKVIADYGTSPDVSEMDLTWFNSGYYSASLAAASGYLRNSSHDVYWMSSNRSTNVLTECVSGWNPKNVGIFTTQDNPDGNTPYKIVLYQSANGAVRDITEVTNTSAFFTLCNSSDGTWYFYDQTDTDLTLYKMNADYTGKTAIKTFSLDEISYNLNDCGMEIMNNRLYFYTMPDSQSSYVLYRYDLY